MSWTNPLQARPQRPVTYRHDGAKMPSTAREVTLGGQRFNSLADAARAYGRSISWVYKRIGEGWRVGCPVKDEA